jgi:hypothetical protein
MSRPTCAGESVTRRGHGGEDVLIGHRQRAGHNDPAAGDVDVDLAYSVETAVTKG